MINKLRLIFGALFVVISMTYVFAQDIQVHGVIIDAQNQEPLIGASVIQKGTTNGTTTDMDGQFTITLPVNSTLLFSYVGYVPEDIIIKNTKRLEIALDPDTKQIGEVVVVGYGSQRVKDLTAPVTTVKGSDLSKQVTANPAQALQGKVAGVQITNNGAPGSGPQIRVRGVGSIGDYASPLYVVDGVYVDNLDFLNSDDIQDLTVLKDASASAIYGVRAANGVILVTTKKGLAGHTNVKFDGYIGLQHPVKILPLCNTTQYVTLINEANKSNPDFKPKVPSQYPASTDWYKELTRDAPMNNANLDISGGTDKTSYTFGLNYFYQDGILNASNNYQRYNMRTRIDQNVYNWLKVGVNVLYSNITKRMPNNDAFFYAFVNPPVYPVYDSKNTEAFPIDYASPQQYGFGNQYGNPVAAAKYYDNKEFGTQLVFSIYSEVDLIKNRLKYKVSYNQDIRHYRNRNYTPRYHVGGSQGNKISILNKKHGQFSIRNIDNLLTYNQSIEQHYFTILLGHSWRMDEAYALEGRAQNVPDYSEQSKYITQGNVEGRNAFDSGSKLGSVSFFMRGTYNYNDRYLATLTVRADGSQKFQEKWGYFPSVGLGWVITSEEFMKNQKLFNNLKLRASWGLLGNGNVPANASTAVAKPGPESSAVFGNILVPGLGSQTVTQNYLKWEAVSEYDFGFDFEMLNRKLTGEFDFYNRTTNRVVFAAPISSAGGVTELLGNNGDVLNRGIEFSINWADAIGEDWNYNAGFNVSTNYNEVKKLTNKENIPGGNVQGNFTTRTQVGHPIGSFYGYKVEGVYQTEAEIPEAQNKQGFKPGFFKYKNIDDNLKIDVTDKEFLGSPIPKVLLGINMGISWKSIDLSMSMNGQFGNKILNAKRMNRNIFTDGNYDEDFFKHRWTGAGSTNKFPSAEALNSGLTQQASSFFVESGSYFSIQNIQLGYVLPKIKYVQKVRVYVSAQRPFTFFSYPGFTTQIGGSPIESGIDKSVYPMQAIYTFGLNVSF